MAAILCQGCSEICNGACDVCSTVMTAPCRLCGNTCEACCSTFGELCTSPFSIYVTVATIFNAPAAFIGFVNLDLTCKGSRWLFLNSLFCITNMAAALYMARTIVSQNPTRDYGGNIVRQKQTSTFQRISHLLCYDPWMALYMLVLLGFFISLWTGAIWSLDGKIYTNCRDDGGLQGRVATALGFGWAFFFFGVGALCISLCCAWCQGDSNDTTGTGTTTSYGKSATGAPTTSYVNADLEKQQASSSVRPSAPPKQDDIPVAHAVLY